MPSGTGCADALSLILPVAVRKHKERKKDKGAQKDCDGRRETADRTKKQKKKSEETFRHQPDQDPFFGTMPGSGTPEADHGVEVLDVPRQQGEQRNVSPKKRQKQERKLRPGNHRLPKSFPVEENHDKDTKDARKQKRQLQTTFTGDSSDTYLGKTHKRESEVELGTSRVGESRRQMHENRVERFDTKGTESENLPTTKEFGQSSVCYLCEKRIEIVEDYKTHLGDVHGKRMFRCERCHCTFSNSEALRVHTHACKSTRIMIRTFRCTVCPKSYSESTSLKVHVRAEHSVEKRTFQCFRCHKQFRYSNAMIRHQRLNCDRGRDEDEKKRKKMLYECNVCSKVYTSSQNLTRHVQTMHEHPVRWTCICAATFPNSPAYYYHMKKCIIRKKLRQI